MSTVEERMRIVRILQSIEARHAAREVSEGTTSAQRINKTIPLKPCALSGCNYPQGDCSGECLPGGVRP